MCDEHDLARQSEAYMASRHVFCPRCGWRDPRLIVPDPAHWRCYQCGYRSGRFWSTLCFTAGIGILLVRWVLLLELPSVVAQVATYCAMFLVITGSVMAMLEVRTPKKRQEPRGFPLDAPPEPPGMGWPQEDDALATEPLQAEDPPSET
jgi:hypothetical protein